MENSTIHVLKASLEPDESGVVQYFISPRTQDGFCPVLSIHPTSGEVSIFSSQKDSDGQFLLFQIQWIETFYE